MIRRAYRQWQAMRDEACALVIVAYRVWQHRGER